MNCTLDQYPPVFICGQRKSEQTVFGFDRAQARLNALAGIAYPMGFTLVSYHLAANLTNAYGGENHNTEIPNQMAAVFNLLHLVAKANGSIWILTADDGTLAPEAEMCLNVWKTHYNQIRINIGTWDLWKPSFEHCDQREIWELLC